MLSLCGFIFYLELKLCTKTWIQISSPTNGVIFKHLLYNLYETKEEKNATHLWSVFLTILLVTCLNVGASSSLDNGDKIPATFCFYCRLYLYVQHRLLQKFQQRLARKIFPKNCGQAHWLPNSLAGLCNGSS